MKKTLAAILGFILPLLLIGVLLLCRIFNINARKFISESVRTLFHNTSSSTCEPGLIFHCSFDNREAIELPIAGPSGVFFENAYFCEGKCGKALLTDAYKICATFNLPKGFLKPAGCVEFWGKILKGQNNVGSGGDPRFFTLCRTDSLVTILGLDLVNNDGGGNSGFSTCSPAGSFPSMIGMRNLSYDDLLPYWQSREWHHYAIVWDLDTFDNNFIAALYIDGHLVSAKVSNEQSVNNILDAINSPCQLGFTNVPAIGSIHCTKSPCAIDEFKIWDYARRDFQLK